MEAPNFNLEEELYINKLKCVLEKQENPLKKSILKNILKEQKIPLEDFKKLCYKIKNMNFSIEKKQKLADNMQMLIWFLEIQQNSEEENFLKTSLSEKKINERINEKIKNILNIIKKIN